MILLLVSVVIPTYNSSETIADCLNSIKDQSYEKVEIVVVDGYSSDGTRKIVRSYDGVSMIIREVGMAEARNIGINNSKGEIIFSVDSDMRLRKDVIKAGVNRIREGLDAVIFPEVSVGEGYFVCIRWLKKWVHLGDLLFESPRMFRREKVEEVGGYDENLLDGEDYDLHYRLRKKGAKIGYVRKVIEHMEGQLSFSEWLKKKKRYRKTTLRFEEKHPDLSAKKGLRNYIETYRRNFSKLLRFPHYSVGLFFMKMLEGCMNG